MKMKTVQLILILSVISVCFNCKTDTPGDTATTGNENQVTTDDVIGKKIVLRIGEKKFSNNDFKQFLGHHYPDISEPTGNPGEGPDNKIISRLFDSFVQHRTVLYIANQHDVTVGLEEVDQYIGKLNVPDNPRGNIDKASVIDAIKVQKFLYARIYDPIKVTENELRNYYNKHLDEFRKKPEVLLYQILLKDKESALKVRGILDNNPSKFEEYAKKESTSMEAQKGGLMGYFEEGTLPKDMEQVVFSLQPHIISPVVESAYGFHIFKITQKKKGRLLYLEKVKSEIRKKLLSEKIRIAYRQFLEKAVQDLAVTIKYESLYFEYQKIKGDKRDEN